MIPRRYRVFAWAVPILFVNWLLLSVIPFTPTNSLVESLARTVLSGTLFGQTALAAAWLAFGPLRFMWRLPLSMVWVTMLVVATAICGWWNQITDQVFVIGVFLSCHWLLLQIPLWGIAIGFGVHVRHAEESDVGGQSAHRQFGIRQLMLVTAIVGVLFGVGRLAVPYLKRETDDLPMFAPIIAFLVAAEVVMTLPLVLAGLMRRGTAVGVLLAIMLIGVITACELPLFKMISPGGGGPPANEFIALNVGTVAVMLLLLTVIRLNGYSLARKQRASAS